MFRLYSLHGTFTSGMCWQASATSCLRTRRWRFTFGRYMSVSDNPFHLIRFRWQRIVCHRHTLPDGHHPPRLRKLRPVLAEPSHIGIVSRSPRDDDKTQEGIRRSKDILHPDRRSTHNRSSYSAIVPECRGCHLQLWGR